MSKSEIDSWHKTALDQDDIKNFCKTNSLPYHMVDLGPNMLDNPFFAFVFTGDTKNEFNKGNTNHWMFCFGPKQPNQQPKLLFDSYGAASSYNLPKPVNMVNTTPKRLQEYAPASVCGQYCCVFYHWLKNEFLKGPDYKVEDVGREFSHHFGFTENRLDNDKLILQEFKQLANLPATKPSHPTVVSTPPIEAKKDAKDEEKQDAPPERPETKAIDVSKASTDSDDISAPKAE